MTSLKGLMYFSFVDHELDHHGLRYIVKRARERNAEIGISGQLHFESGMFLQWIEGTQENVEKVFRYIKRDPHHSGVQVVYEGPIRNRFFGGWDMAFSSNDSLQSFLQTNRLSLENPDSSTVSQLISFLRLFGELDDQQIESIRPDLLIHQPKPRRTIAA